MNKFKYICCFFVFSMLVLAVTGCTEIPTTTLGSDSNSENAEDSEVDMKLVARFYTNSGDMWFEAYGKSFNLQPNRVKDYAFDEDGDWTYTWDTSSIVTCYIDGHQVDTCGSTAIFKDASLVPCDIDFNDISNGEPLQSGSTSDDISINATGVLDFETYFKIQYWWLTHLENGGTPKSRILIVQSQDGSPIEMYMGDEVYWSISSLPKTTYFSIDGKELYLHRSNFAVIDTALLPTM